MKKFFDFGSKTLTSFLLGAILILADSVGNFEGAPQIALTIAQALVFAFGFFGIYDAAKASEEGLIAKLMEFSKTKYGVAVLLGTLTYLTNTIPNDPNAPSGLVLAAKIAGAILTTLLGGAGAREFVVKARMNNAPLPKKYTAYK